jgi:hypothetical protein
MPTRNTSDPAPREMRKQEHVSINTDIDLDPRFDTFRIFLRSLDSQVQDEYEEALGDGLIFNEMSIIRPPTMGANSKKTRHLSRLRPFFCFYSARSSLDYVVVWQGISFKRSTSPAQS